MTSLEAALGGLSLTPAGRPPAPRDTWGSRGSAGGSGADDDQIPRAGDGLRAWAAAVLRAPIYAAAEEEEAAGASASSDREAAAAAWADVGGAADLPEGCTVCGLALAPEGHGLLLCRWRKGEAPLVSLVAEPPPDDEAEGANGGADGGGAGAAPAVAAAAAAGSEAAAPTATPPLAARSSAEVNAEPLMTRD